MTTSFHAAGDRYERLEYRRAGRSGLDLPAVSLGLWQKFGTDHPFATQREIVLHASCVMSTVSPSTAFSTASRKLPVPLSLQLPTDTTEGSRSDAGRATMRAPIPGNDEGRAGRPSTAQPVRSTQRWRALKRGLDLQITKTLPRRRTTLQSR